MTKVIAVVNQKGGVAKTTSTVHLGAAIAETGKKVLLVDLDSKGHIAEAFNVVADEIEYDMSDVFEGKKRIVDIIMPDVRTNLDVAPSNVRLADVETNGKLAS
jgi:chromosome partitioning protein